MAETHDTLLRQWQMLRNIPKYPQKITASELNLKLERNHYKTSKRTIERDLKSLSLVFPLMLDDRNKPYGWSWQRDTLAFNLPGIDKNEALVLLMLEEFLSGLLPTSTLDVLTPQFKLAKSFLNQTSKEEKLKSWVNKVRVVPANQPLLPPKIDYEIQRTISESLLMNRQCIIKYQKTNHRDPTEFRIHPLAITQRGSIVYLTVKIFDYEDIRTLALHRIKSAMMLDESVKFPKNFNIDEEISKGLFEFGNGKEINFEAIFSPELGQRLIETKLSENQYVEILSNGQYQISASVIDTPQLEWWLLSLGAGVKVIKPNSIRKKIILTHQNAMNLYKN